MSGLPADLARPRRVRGWVAAFFAALGALLLVLDLALLWWASTL